jgi:3-hydroxyisobutyrate dehydrogenase
MNIIAFYGTGMLGSGFIKHLRAQGLDVNVWNRSYEKAKALESTGARAFEEAAQAARGAEIVHLCVRDGQAVDETLTAALPGIAKGTPIVDHTTVDPKSVPPRAKRLESAGYPFLHAPVFMGPPQAETGVGTMLASGPKELFDRLDPQLAKLASKRQYLGERVDAAALYKLMGNLLILSTIGGLSDMFALAEANGIDRADAYKLFSFYSPQGQIEGRGKRIAQNEYDPTWTADMALKDATLMQAAANGTKLPVVDAVVSELHNAIARGHADLDLGAIAKR